jgi:hypothetical protein
LPLHRLEEVRRRPLARAPLQLLPTSHYCCAPPQLWPQHSPLAPETWVLGHALSWPYLLLLLPRPCPPAGAEGRQHPLVPWRGTLGHPQPTRALGPEAIAVGRTESIPAFGKNWAQSDIRDRPNPQAGARGLPQLRHPSRLRLFLVGCHGLARLVPARCFELLHPCHDFRHHCRCRRCHWPRGPRGRAAL